MNMLSTRLAAAQSALQDRILLGEAVAAPRIAGDDAGERLRIYADAYRLRLVETLGNDFPAVRTAVGDEAFAMLAERYLQAHPSTRPSVRHVGSAFADWLRSQADAPAGLHELARFEWTMAAAFDAIDAPAMGFDDVAALPADAWPALRLRLHPSTQLLDAHRLAARDDAIVLAGEDDATHWLLWRDGSGDVHWRQLEADEAGALHAASRGANFGDLCERLTALHGDDGALRAASLLKRWLADGLLAAATPVSD